jgi:hypothetical protein
MASTNFSTNGPMPSHIRANGNATARAPTRAGAEDKAAADPEGLMPASTETLKSGQRKPIGQEPSMELVYGGRSAEIGWRDDASPAEIKWIKRFRRDCLNDIVTGSTKPDWKLLVNRDEAS